MLFECPGILRRKVRVAALFLVSAHAGLPAGALAKGPPKISVPESVFEYKELGQEFKIRVPANWNAESGAGGLAVTLRPSERAPRVKLPGGLIADPSITVAVAKKPVTLTNEALETVAKEIEESFIRFNGAATQFKIFQKNLISDLPNGRSAFLYYVSFVADGHDAGQAILVTGTDKVRYRVTLSDHRINFDKNLENFYPFMTSLEFNGNQLTGENSAKGLTGGLLYWVIAFVSAGIIVGLVARLRRKDNDEEISEDLMGGASARLSPEQKPVQSSAPAFNQSQYPLSQVSNIGVAPAGVSHADEPGPDAAVYSAIPQSRIGMADSSSEGPVSSEFSDVVFTEKDLSAPPQSVPLSQVVDETSAPPEMKKKWQISGNTKKQ